VTARKTERGPWRRLMVETVAANDIRCGSRGRCARHALWMRSWRAAEMRAPEFEYSCREHAEGLVEAEQAGPGPEEVAR